MAYEFKGRTRGNVEAETARRRPPRAERTRDQGPARAPRAGRSLMQTLAAVFGATFLLAGIGGFIPGVTSNYDELELWGPESGAKLLGLFEVSIVHNIVHLLFAVGLLAAARYSSSRLYLLGGGLTYLVVVLYGAFVEKESDANFLPLNDADNLLHLVLGLGMIAGGVVAMRLAEGRTGRT